MPSCGNSLSLRDQRAEERAHMGMRLGPQASSSNQYRFGCGQILS